MNIKNYTPNHILILTLCIVCLFFPFRYVEAASLSFSSAATEYNVGQLFSVNVLVSADAGESVNAVGATIGYPNDLVTLVSLSKTKSILNFWTQDPTSSNASGLATFEGVVLNPGFSGKGGNVLTMVFKVKVVGVAKLSFSSASVLANDGQGTNILKDTFSYSISTKLDQPQPVKTEPLQPVVVPVQAEPEVKQAKNVEPVVNNSVVSTVPVELKLSVEYISFIIVGIFALLAIIGISIYSVYYFKRLHRRLTKKLQAVEKGIVHDLDVLREDLGTQKTFTKHIGMVEEDITAQLREIEKVL